MHLVGIYILEVASFSTTFRGLWLIWYMRMCPLFSVHWCVHSVRSEVRDSSLLQYDTAISSHIHYDPIAVPYQISQRLWPKEPSSIVVSDRATTKNAAAGSSDTLATIYKKERGISISSWTSHSLCSNTNRRAIYRSLWRLLVHRRLCTPTFPPCSARQSNLLHDAMHGAFGTFTGVICHLRHTKICLRYLREGQSICLLGLCDLSTYEVTWRRRKPHCANSLTTKGNHLSCSTDILAGVDCAMAKCEW